MSLPFRSDFSWLSAALRIALVLAVGGVISLPADWRTDSGWVDLELFLGSPPVDGAGVVLGQIEATGEDNNNYLPATPTDGANPFPGTGSFAGKTFYPLTGEGGLSSHAASVGNLFYGNTTSLVPGATEVYCQSAAGFIYLTLGAPHVNPDNPIPALEVPRAVDGAAESAQSHAYIGVASELETAAMDDLAARMDFFINETGAVAVVGLANGSGNPVPPLWNSAYNVISAGRNDGNHSTGATPAPYAGAGRVKPELVAPLGTTSASTGAIASAAAYLQAAATELGLGSDGRRAETIKAVLMAGASKEPFPEWDNSNQPLDARFGAGAVDLVSAHRILAGGRFTPGTEESPTLMERRGWARAPVDADTPAVFRIVVPAMGNGAEASVVLTWNRPVTEVRSGGPNNRTYTYEASGLADLALSLTGPNGLNLASDSPVDNVEHVFARDLEPGEYVLTVASHSVDTTDFALAWRFDLLLRPSVRASADSASELIFTGLAEDWPFWIERGSALETWSLQDSFAAEAETQIWSDPAPLDPVGFYRLKWFAP